MFFFSFFFFQAEDGIRDTSVTGVQTCALPISLPMGGTRGCALPLLFRLYVGATRGGRADAPSRSHVGKRQQAADAAHAVYPRRTKLALARELVALVARWAGERPVY